MDELHPRRRPVSILAVEPIHAAHTLTVLVHSGCIRAKAAQASDTRQ